MLSHPIWQQKGGAFVNSMVSFLVSVGAGIVSYYICKWLDGHDSDNYPKKKASEVTSLGLSLCAPVARYPLADASITYAKAKIKYIQTL